MILAVTRNYLANATNALTWEAFKELTGSKIDLNKRVGKEIYLYRDGGHVYISDTEFIVGEKYKKSLSIFECKYLNEDGTALLAAINNNLSTLTSKEPLEFRII